MNPPPTYLKTRWNWDEAERLYRQSLEVMTELGDRSGMASSIGCLGEIEMLRGNLDAAEWLISSRTQLITQNTA
ncbi:MULTISPECIES: hypothetical protein [unclassified Microcoleus]|uniref:hypothetical protein n=1 Tax=unclassified Microcoleus TaxID=2642155 RepID=UPI002FD5F4CE